MKNAIVAIILKVVDPSVTIIKAFIAATIKKMIAVMPYIHLGAVFIDIVISPNLSIHGMA